MTVVLSCEGDNDNVGKSSNDHNRTWLEIKKEKKGAAAVPVSIRENLAEEFDKLCADSTVAKGTIHLSGEQ